MSAIEEIIEKSHIRSDEKTWVTILCSPERSTNSLSLCFYRRISYLIECVYHNFVLILSVMLDRNKTL